MGVLFPCKRLLQIWSIGWEAFGETLSWWTSTRTTSNWPLIILCLFAIPFYGNERESTTTVPLYLHLDSAMFKQKMLRATQVPMQEFICDLRFRHLKVWREADFSCPRAVNKKAVTYHKWCGSFESGPRGSPFYIPSYLYKDLDKHVLRNVSRFRLRAHHLRVESCKWHGGSSICDKCECGEVQDEKHVLFFCKCAEARELRMRYRDLFERMFKTLRVFAPAFKLCASCTNFLRHINSFLLVLLDAFSLRFFNTNVLFLYSLYSSFFFWCLVQSGLFLFLKLAFLCYSSTALAGGYSCVTLTLTLTRVIQYYHKH